jgi:phosphatidate cytidylyltransferase
LCGLSLRAGGLPVWLTSPATVLVSAFAEPSSSLFVLAIGVGVGMLQDAGRNRTMPGGRPGRWSAAGATLFGATALAAMYLRIWVPGGAATILWLFAVVWASDIGAYFSGRALGGPKLAPAISPAKTWSGLAGGLVLAMIVGAVGGYLKVGAINLPSVAVALVVALASVGGDLLESFVKRQFGAKDSGAIMPGHGGVLDRIDGLLTAAPVLAIIAAFSTGDPITWQ